MIMKILLVTGGQVFPGGPQQQSFSLLSLHQCLHSRLGYGSTRDACAMATMVAITTMAATVCTFWEKMVRINRICGVVIMGRQSKDNDFQVNAAAFMNFLFRQTKEKMIFFILIISLKCRLSHNVSFSFVALGGKERMIYNISQKK